MLSFEGVRTFLRDQFNVRAHIDKVKRDFHESPPPLRDLFPSGFAVIAKEDTGEQIGVLVFELYELELAELPNPPTDADKIDCFNKALIPVYYPDSTPENRKERMEANALIRKKIEKKFQACYDENKPIPAAISKLQAEYYLRNLEQAGLEVVELNGIKPNVDTGRSANRANTREKMAHYFAQWASWSLTSSVALVTAMTMGIGYAPFAFAITYVAKKSGNDFGMYDTAEALLRDSGWMFSKKLGLRGNIDRIKALKTLGYVIAIGVTTFLAAHAAWLGALALPGWGMLSLALPASILNAAQVGLGAYFATIAGITTFLGSIVTTRFFCTLSPFDNQIPFSKATAVQKEEWKSFTQEAYRNNKIERNFVKALGRINEEMGPDVLDRVLLQEPAKARLFSASAMRTPQLSPQVQHDGTMPDMGHRTLRRRNNDVPTPSHY